MICSHSDIVMHYDKVCYKITHMQFYLVFGVVLQIFKLHHWQVL